MHASIRTQHWLGKGMGFACALLWAPTDPLWLPLGLIAAISLGHCFDLWSAQQSDSSLSALLDHGLKPGTGSAQQNNSNATPELHFLFSAAGRISKASGKVTPAHIQQAEATMKALRLTGSARTLAIAWFDEGKSARTDFAALAQACLKASNGHTSRRAAIVQNLCAQAVIEPSNACVNELKKLAGMLGFAPGRVGQMFGEAHSQRTVRREPPNPQARTKHSQAQSAANPTPAHVIAAYEYLDLAVGSNKDVTKQAYRRLVSRYHPDRLKDNATAGQISHAQRKMVELRDALETIEAFLEK